MEQQKLPIRIRPATAEDVSFIFSSWLKSYRNSNSCKIVSNTIYYANQHIVIEDILKRSTVLIACNNNDPAQIYGYTVFEQLNNFIVLHYIYVKHDFRNFGIGKMLLKETGHDITKASLYTHHTDIATRMAPNQNLVYHPFLAYDTFVKSKDSNEPDAE